MPLSYFSSNYRTTQLRLKLFRKKVLARGSELGLIFSAALVGIAAGCAVSGMSWISKSIHSLVFGISHDQWLSSAIISNKLLLFAAPVFGGGMMGVFFLFLQKRRSTPIVDPIEANALYGGNVADRQRYRGFAKSHFQRLWCIRGFGGWIYAAISRDRIQVG